MMKVGIVGIGAVGAATAMAIVLRARVRELILINRNRAHAKAVATDMHYGVPLSPLVRVADGEYSDLAGARVTIIAAGVNEKSGGATDRNDPLGRLRLLDANVKVFEEIVPRIVEVAPQSVLLIAHRPAGTAGRCDRKLAAYHLFELGSAASQLAIVLASAAIITGLTFLVYLAGALGVVGAVLGLIAWQAPTMLHL
jgi:L-lactate dehydrogenase